MNRSRDSLLKYRKFLESIPLDEYRVELKDIKVVEQDLHPSLFPLPSIFESYWEKQNFFSFEDWFNKFWLELSKEQKSAKKINEFKEVVSAHRKFYEDKINNDLDKLFFTGFKARMYRTWVSVLTQLDFCYVCEYVRVKEGKNLTIECNAELDAQGIDVKINDIEFQIKKITKRKEALRIDSKKKIIILYTVFDIPEFERLSESPRVKDKQGYKKALDAFHKYFILLQNGFVVFKEDYVKPIIDKIYSHEEVKKVVEKIVIGVGWRILIGGKQDAKSCNRRCGHNKIHAPCAGNEQRTRLGSNENGA